MRISDWSSDVCSSDLLEARIHDGRDGYLWDAQGWYGGDINKLWIKTEGEGSFGEKLEEAEVQALWSRAITPWFDVQAGLRYDFRPNPDRKSTRLNSSH